MFATTLILSLATCAIASADGELLINSFESAADVARVEVGQARFNQVTHGATDGRLALRVQFPNQQWPSLVLRHGQGFDESNWEQFGGLVFDVTNPDPQQASIAVSIDDAGSAKQPPRRRNAWATIDQGTSTVVFYFPMHGLGRMRAGPPLVPGPVTILGQDNADIDWANIQTLHITLSHPGRERSLIFDRIRLMPKPDLTSIVDRFGQYTRADWPGKVISEQDMQSQREAEARKLKEHPVCPDRDEFGGWSAGPQLASTGFFRTAYVVGGKETTPPTAGQTGTGRWWLVTPNGGLFFSLGVDVINHFDTTPINGRAFLFEELPKPDDVLGLYRTDSGVRFYAMNLHRRYGRDWPDRWVDVSLARMKAWGFNTIGAWSDGRLFAAHKVPYTVCLSYGFDGIKTIDAGHRQMPDVFDEKFATVVDQAIANQTARWEDDPWCVGYFVDNEPAWAGWGNTPEERYQLARRILASKGELPAKQAFISYLKERYSRWSDLKQAWKSDLFSWGELERGGFDWPAKMTQKCQSDLGELTTLFAEKYFSTVAASLKKHAPQHMYLGCRFAPRQDEVVRAAARHCDVLSFNIYTQGPTPDEWGFTSELGRPCIIGEFHFGALDRGMFHYGMQGVADQAARGQAYQEYVKRVAALPAFVGCHWFQYADEPLTGRSPDGENFNIGLVSIVDEPYPELVDAASLINCRIYTLIEGKND